jgi:hypothetical protein
MASVNFPNLFFTYGPHAPTAFANGPPLVEFQGEWVAGCLDYMKKNGKARIEPRREAEEKWREQVTTFINASLFPFANSWYMGANIPGKKRESMCYLGGVPLYIKECNGEAEKGYEGFVFN